MNWIRSLTEAQTDLGAVGDKNGISKQHTMLALCQCSTKRRERLLMEQKTDPC